MAILQLKRGTAARWFELNPVLAVGEPGFEYDTKKLKIGDGSTAWNNLPYVGEGELYTSPTFTELPNIGDSNCLYRVVDEKTLYQWNPYDHKYEALNNAFNPNEITIIHGGNANG